MTIFHYASLIDLQLPVDKPRRNHFREVWGPQPSHRIPPRYCRETRGTTSLVATRRNIVQNPRIRVQNRINESHTTLPNVHSGSIHQRHHTPKSRRTSRRTVNVGKVAIDSFDIVHAISGDVGDSAGVPGSVVAVRAVGGKVVLEIGLEGCVLVGGCSKDIGEAPSGPDYGLGCFFWLGYADAGLDLGGAHGGDIGASGRERRGEHPGCTWEMLE